MIRNSGRLGARAGATLLLAGGLTACVSAGRVVEMVGIPRRDAPPPAVREAEQTKQTLAGSAGKYVVIDLDVNELRFMDGDRALWAAPVGTGTGLRLRGAENEWEFSTPNGVFHVQFKEENPVWILPDWYFVKNKLPIPPDDSPKRRMPGALGSAAVYLGDEIAIHGTDKPELLGQRVSHGCIRLADENAKRLFHNVQVGTPVIIVGGIETARDASLDSVPAPTNPGAPRKQPRDPAARLSTAQLLRRLDQQVAAADTSSKWTGTASLLISRGITDDADALRGLLRRAGKTDSQAFEREYATFVADAFARGSLRAVVSLARVDAAARERAALAIVQATMDLYHGALDDPGAPWPTRRVPRWRLGPDGTKGWEALRAAEEVYRSELAPSRRVVLRTDGR